MYFTGRYPSWPWDYNHAFPDHRNQNRNSSALLPFIPVSNLFHVYYITNLFLIKVIFHGMIQEIMMKWHHDY